MPSTPICKDTRPCFGRLGGRCGILTKAIPNCPFCKPYREITKGKMYLINEEYGSDSQTIPDGSH